MHTSNLSALVTHQYFFQLLEREQIHYDWIISDKNLEIISDNFLLLNKPLSELVLEKKIQNSDSVLLILDKVGGEIFLGDLLAFENVIILNTYSGLASFGHKISPAVSDYKYYVDSGFELIFPFDEDQFFMGLSKKGRSAFFLINQEIADSIYTPSEEDEFAFVDKAIAEQPLSIALINNPEAPTHIIMMGNYFEEGVKLSQYLLNDEKAYHLTLIGKLSMLDTDYLQDITRKAKKLMIIIDQKETLELKNMLASRIGFPVSQLVLIAPQYGRGRSFLADYQLFDCQFDAEHLSEQIVHA